MNNDTSLSLLVLLVAAVGVAMLITCVPVPAGEVCLTYRQARHLWPTRHLWWYNDDGDKCWSNRHGGPPRGLKIEPERKKEKKLRTDPIFPPRAEAKVIDPAEVNELDEQAQAKPFSLFPDLNAKVNELLDLWRHRWDTK